MTNKEIIKTLKDFKVKKGGGIMEYERAKRIICLGPNLSSDEYEARLKVIAEYIGI